jgi:hypothetical protein
MFLGFASCDKEVYESRYTAVYSQSLVMTMECETDGHSEIDASVQSSESDDRFSSLLKIHSILHEILTSFQPIASHIECCRHGEFQIKISSMEMEIKFLKDVQKILISSCVYDSSVHPRKTQERRSYRLFTSMMRLNSLLSQAETMDQIKCLGGKFIFFQYVRLCILNKKIRFHTMLEDFMMTCVGIQQEFKRVDAETLE